MAIPDGSREAAEARAELQKFCDDYGPGPAWNFFYAVSPLLPWLMAAVAMLLVSGVGG